MKPRYSFVVPLRDDELDDAINRLYCGCLLSLAERERIAAWMETKRVYTVPEAPRSEEAAVLAAAKRLAHYLEEGWDEQDDPADVAEADGACDGLVKAVKALLCAPSPLRQIDDEPLPPAPASGAI